MPKTKTRARRPVPITARSTNIGTTTTTGTASGPALIRKFHTLQTALAAAASSGDTPAQTLLEAEIERLGGLGRYQRASLRGQDRRRGGDSSKTLVEWLKSPDVAFACPSERRMRVLEIGSLDPDNHIARDRRLAVSRIDLNSQGPAIVRQDFLQRPAPASPEEEFEGISCSLVLNFVPGGDRSDFLLHLTRFLPVSDDTTTRWLFFVLPAPCVANSRYMNRTLMMRMFETLGFALVKEKMTDRIAYWLFKRVGPVVPDQSYRKTELQSGKTRNNFFIALKTPNASDSVQDRAPRSPGMDESS